MVNESRRGFFWLVREIKNKNQFHSPAQVGFQDKQFFLAFHLEFLPIYCIVHFAMNID